MTVRLNGKAAPLYFVSPTQINFQVPWELLTSRSANVTVTTEGGTSQALVLHLAPVTPGISTVSTSDSPAQGVIQVNNSAVIAAAEGAVRGAMSRPAREGDVLTIYCTGLGEVKRVPPDGQAGSAGSTASTAIQVTIGGMDAPVLFAGLSFPVGGRLRRSR